MRIDLYTLMYNEHDNIPHVLNYWNLLRQEADLRVYIYDNHSTDDSVSLLSGYDWIEIRHFETDGMDDIAHARIKNACWKESRGRADWCIVCDFDEVLYSRGCLVQELEIMRKNGYNVLGTKWYAFCGSSPQYNIAQLLHRQVGRGYEQYVNHMEQFRHLGKFMLIDPNSVDDMGWSVGNHITRPSSNLRIYVSSKIVAFHINKGYNEDYFVSKRREMGDRLSASNRRYGMGIEYTYPEEKSRLEYRKCQAESVDISQM